MLNFINEVLAMKGKRMLTIPIITGVLAFVGGWAISAQDKYTVKVRMGSRSLSSEDTRPGRSCPSVRTETLLLRSSLIL
jgi:hypothetical protein